MVVEYRERQPSESVVPIDKRTKVSGLPRDPLRMRYDQRRRDVLPKHGLKLIELGYKDFDCDSRMRLRRIPADIDVVRGILVRAEIIFPGITVLKLY
jgi:hypothetical protein